MRTAEENVRTTAAVVEAVPQCDKNSSFLISAGLENIETFSTTNF